jgi:plastocyanin/uncharacterized protein (DUF2141 family)
MRMQIRSNVFYKVAAILCAGAALSGFAAVSTVSVQDDVFVPSSSSIHAGDSVIWKWDGSDHNVTSTSNPQAWKATPTESSTTFTFTNTFASAGTFPYECTIHASIGMLGTISVAAAVSPPTITITSPASGAMLPAPANVTIAATTTDAGGTVTNVQFLVGATLLKTVTSAPFSAVTNGLPAGSYTLSAIATDNNGLKATNMVGIQVLSPPTVSITSPASGALLAAPANVTIAATTTGGSGTVTSVGFLVGSTVLSTVTSAPFSAVTNGLPPGSYTLSAVATDNNGLTATNTVSIQVFTPASLGNSIKLSATQFQFSYAATPGISYVIQQSTNLTTWVSIATNIATANPATYSDDNATNNPAFYRVQVLPNP